MGTADDARAPFRPGVGLILAGGLLALYVLFGVLVASHVRHGLDPKGGPLFYDFSAFYQAGAFADAGHAAAAYDDKAMIAAEQAAFPGSTARLPWNYPPTFQLLMAPLAALPYGLAWLVWSCALYGAYAWLARQVAPVGRRWIVLLAPGAAINILVGQNGLFSTVLMGGGVMMLAARPLLGGALLGLMTYKPHFAVLIPLVLAAGRQWRALAASAASALAAAALSALVLGPEAWIAFAHKALQPAALFTSSSSAISNIPSVMILARGLGLPAPVASACHWTLAALAAGAAAWVWRRSADGRVRAGALAAATLLVTPYLRVYDLILLALPIAVLIPREDGEGERTLARWALVLAAWALPAVLLFADPPVQFGPLVSMAMLAAIALRPSPR